VPAPGTRFANPALAATYKRVLALAEAAGGDREAEIEAARRAWYDGFVAEEIGKFATTEVMDVTEERHRGLLTGHDLATWHARLEAPVTYDYQGLTIGKTQPWGQGPVFLQQLALLRGLDLADVRPGSAEFIHILTECGKLAFADREAWYGDPEFTEVPLADLLSPAYNDERRRLIGDTASAEFLPGRPGGREARLPEFAKGPFGMIEFELDSRGRRRSGDPGIDPGTGEPLGRSAWTQPQARRGDTCHLDVADRWGNVVTATPSGGWLQSSPVIPALGFCLGTRAQMFTLTPGLPATLAPGKRPRTTLTPTLVLRDGEPYLAFGTPGGDQQDQWTLHFFLNHVHFGMNMQQAIDFPSFHSAHMPSSFYPRESYPRRLDVEERVGSSVVDELTRRGHDVRVQPPWSLGRISAVARRDGMLYAAANPRGMQGYAVGR
jgi:gamma-glutamyltranspeptidase/glutathione hydrolase